MGEVYRARDTRLDRTVAIKIVPQHLSSNPQSRERFDREAKAISSLSHPHICPLYDVGHQDGIDYLVMEHLEGETLASRLRKGPLLSERALEHAIQIADALDTAHRHGVIHRDLKPGNIMLTKTGAKLLDFGLAKVRAAEAVAGITAMPTQTTPLSRKAFAGESQASLISAIMSSEPPPPSTVQAMAPLALDHVVKTCLAKDPDARWQTAHDVLVELKWIAQTSSQPLAVAQFGEKLRVREYTWMATAIGLFLAAVALAVLYLRRPQPDGPVTRFTIQPPEKSSVTGTIAVSPDGRGLAFVATDSSGKDQLWVRALDSFSGQRLSGTEGASFPFWSPDSRTIGFFAQGKLKAIAVSGGPPRPLCDVSQASGGTWNKDGVILYTPNPGSGLYRVTPAGGPCTAVTKPDESQERSHRWPVFLPDNRHFVYFGDSGKPDVRGVYIGSLDSQKKNRLFVADVFAGFAAPGYLLFVRERTLMAQPFDVSRLQVQGEPVPLAEHIWSDPEMNGLTAFSASENGVLAYRSGGATSNRLIWFDRAGKQLGLVASPGGYADPALSPNGKQLAISIGSSASDTDIWLIDLSTQISSRVTFGRESSIPIWSPDGKRIVFQSMREGSPDLYQKVLGQSGDEELVLKSNLSEFPSDWSADGRFIVYEIIDPKTGYDLWVLPMEGDQKPMPFLHTSFNETNGRFSPNGRWMAYVSDETGEYQVYVTGFPSHNGKWQVSASGGSEPSWRPDGKELFYMAADQKLMAVEVKSDSSTFHAGAAIPLFQTHTHGLIMGFRHYVTTADGKRFLVVTPVEEDLSSPINVVLNWAAGLKR